VLLPLLESALPLVLGVLDPVLGDALGELPGVLSLAELLRVPFLLQPARPSATMIAAAVISRGFFFMINFSFTGLFVASSPAPAGFELTGALRNNDEVPSPHCSAPVETVYPSFAGIEYGKLSGLQWEILPGYP